MIQRKGKDERTEGPAAHMMQSRGPRTRVLGNVQEEICTDKRLLTWKERDDK